MHWEYFHALLCWDNLLETCHQSLKKILCEYNKVIVYLLVEHTMMMSDQTSSCEHLFWNNITDSLSISHTDIKAQDFLHEHRSSFRVIIDTSWVIIQSLWKHASRKVSAIAPLTTDVMQRTIYTGARMQTWDYQQYLELWPLCSLFYSMHLSNNE